MKPELVRLLVALYERGQFLTPVQCKLIDKIEKILLKSES